MEPRKQQLNTTLPAPVQHVLSVLHDSGFQAFVVGGAVRDLLLGRTPKDWDITTNALPDAVRMVFPHTVPTGEKYGTITVVFDDTQVEVTTYRKDGVYSDGRRPDIVEFSESAEDDVLRRDSTINGLLYDGVHVYDYVGGLTDIQFKFISAIGEPAQRIQEDALRMLRYIRQASQLGFEIDQRTLISIRANSVFIENVARERVRDELVKILVSPDPARGLDLLRSTLLLDRIAPELARLVGFQQKSKYHHKDVWGHTLEVVSKVPATPIHRLAALLHDVGKPATFTVGDDGEGHFYGHHLKGYDIALEFMERLKFSNDERDRVALLVREHMSRLEYLRAAPVKKFITRVGKENLEVLFDLMMADSISHAPPFWRNIEKVVALRQEVNEVLDAGEPLTVKDLDITGADLIDMGLTPGPLFSKLLNRLLEIVLSDPSQNANPTLRRYAAELVPGLQTAA